MGHITERIKKVLTTIEKAEGLGLSPSTFLDNEHERDILTIFINRGVVDFNHQTYLLTINARHRGYLSRFYND